MGEGVGDIRRQEVNALLLAMRQGSHAGCWGKLYDILFPFAISMVCRNRLDASSREDVVQESFIRLKQVCERYDPTADGLSFYSGILRNVIKEHLSRNRRYAANWQKYRERQIASAGGASKSICDCDRLVTSDAIQFGMGKLSPLLAQAIELRIIHGLACKAAAVHAECSVAAMKRRTARAILTLRREILDMERE